MKTIIVLHLPGILPPEYDFPGLIKKECRDLPPQVAINAFNYSDVWIQDGKTYRESTPEEYEDVLKNYQRNIRIIE